MIGGGDRLPLRDRLVVADGATGALVVSDGTVDWWCPDRVDGSPLFWRLLDRGGAALRVGPRDRSASEQVYLPGTLVPRTVHTTARGAVEVIDVLPREDRPHPPTLLRFVTVVRGEVDLEVDLHCGRAWRSSTRWDVFDGGVAFDGWVLRAPGLDFVRNEHGGCASRHLRGGDRLVVSLRRTDEPELAEREAIDLLDRTAAHWRRLGGSTLYGGPFASAVRRSVQVLHGVASRSITTSVAVPTREDLAVDSRLRWVTDAASTALLLDELGHHDDAAGARAFLRTVLERPLVPVAAVDGGEAPEGDERSRLDGFLGGPVRVGLAGPLGATPVMTADADSAADAVRPLPAPITDAIGALAPLFEALEAERRPALRSLAGIAADAAVPPHLAGRARAWAFLDAATRSTVRRDPLDLAAASWRQSARELERAFLDDLPESTDDDPRLLRLAWQGPLPANHELVARTVDRVLARRSEGPFVHGDELGSTAASWWAVRALACLERWEEAHERAERLVAWAGDAALLPRSVEPAGGRFAGDLPDATAHLALLAAAQTLAAGPR